MIKEKDPAMKYEKIVRFAFDCGRYDDPLGLAHADTYDGNYKSTGFRLKLGLSYSLFRIGKKLSEDKFEDLSEQALSAERQKEIIAIMDETIDTVNKIADQKSG